MNILVLTSTFPRWKDDTDPRFVEHLCQNLAGEHSVHVVAPHARGALSTETIGKVTVFRYRYFFAAGESLAYEGGILPNLKKIYCCVCENVLLAPHRTFREFYAIPHY